MNVLSLFDWMSCWQIALERAWIKVDQYYASEIKKGWIVVTQHNYPNTIQLGDVRNIKAKDLPRIDLLIWGSPCQDLSIANRERKWLEWDKSWLFREYVRLLKELKPKYFLLENVKMTDENYEIISNTLWVYPVNINSSLVSAQQRNRFYRTNIWPQGSDLFWKTYCQIPQPEDKHIEMKDIIEDWVVDREKSRAIMEADSRPHSSKDLLYRRYKEIWFGNIVYLSEKEMARAIETRRGKLFETWNRSWDMTLDRLEVWKSMCLMSSDFWKGSRTTNLIKDELGIRILTQLECERLQTVPEWYTNILSRNKAVWLLWDWRTVDVIVHILKYI
jgi:DNA (cytosine-5)-methyltransferase 3A